ncbi:MAG: hypothetical protein Q9N68_08200 [Gammaproteobacteria bacterium]|nr:hypothetical protein [Gammaproteobacteria bacterium]
MMTILSAVHRAVFFFLPLVMFFSSSAQAAESTLIELTQVPCQFLESEKGINHGFASQQLADCVAINEKTQKARLAKANILRLAAGSYTFRVINKNVPYELGFWLRGDGLINRARLPSVSGGGIKTASHRDYEIELKAGKYVYSCPLNNTPDYTLVVK